MDVMEKRSAILSLRQPQYDAFNLLNGEKFKFRLERRGFEVLHTD